MKLSEPHDLIGLHAESAGTILRRSAAANERLKPFFLLIVTYHFIQ
jgi:hypothetical protein